ncbi:MAG: hypothetical protein WC942_11025 [Clostridia bacterium]|jgi:hypothetical protein
MKKLILILLFIPLFNLFSNQNFFSEYNIFFEATNDQIKLERVNQENNILKELSYTLAIYENYIFKNDNSCDITIIINNKPFYFIFEWLEIYYSLGMDEKLNSLINISDKEFQLRVLNNSEFYIPKGDMNDNKEINK